MLDGLPNDIITYLMKNHCDLKTSNMLSQTCKRFHSCFLLFVCDGNSGDPFYFAMYHYCCDGLVEAYERLRRIAGERIERLKKYTLLNCACYKQQIDMVRLLMRDGFPVVQEHFEQVLSAGHVNVMEVLLTGTLRPTAREFVITCSQGNRPMIRLMLKAGMNPNASLKFRDENITGLELAIGNNHNLMVGLLLDNGAMPEDGPSLVRKYIKDHPRATRRLINHKLVRAKWDMSEFDLKIK